MRHVCIVAGEPSGDLLAAALIRALRERGGDLRFTGIAGPAMQAAGCAVWEPLEPLAVMGVPEIIRRYPRLRTLQRRAIDHFLSLRPDLFIGVDAPEFNLGVEVALHATGIRTAHYVSPTVWAWRESRLKDVRRGVDLMLTLFPFEEDYYRARGVPVAFVGHPLADELAVAPCRDEARLALGLESARPLLALLPGSRGSELRYHSGPFLRAASLCAETRPELQVAAALVDAPAAAALEAARARVAPALPMKSYAGRAREVLAAADIGLIASGTATLEAMLLGCPMVVAYRAAWLSYVLIRPLLRISRFALPNLLAGDDIVPECIQGDARPRRMASEVLALLGSSEAQARQRERFLALKGRLGRDASGRAAAAVLALAR